jgi:hypothetical protein
MSWYGGAWNVAPARAAPTEAELSRDRAEALQAAVADVDMLLRVPVLAANPRTLMFELTRCHMFKGELLAVLEAALTAVRAKDGFGVGSAPLEGYLGPDRPGAVKRRP